MFRALQNSQLDIRRISPSAWAAPFFCCAGSVGQFACEHKLVVHGHPDGGSGGCFEDGLADGKIHGCDGVKVRRNADGSLQVVHCGGLILLQCDRRGDSLSGQFVGFDRRFETFGKEGGDVFQSEAVVASIPGKAMSAAVFHPKNRAVEDCRILHGEPQISGFCEGGCDPCRLSAGGCGGEDLDQIGVTDGAGQPCEVGIRAVFPCLRDGAEAVPALSGLESLVFAIFWITEDSRARHAKFDGAGGDANAAGFVGHGESGVVSQRGGADKAADQVRGVDHVVSVFQQQCFGDFAGSDLSFGGECQ